MVNRIKIRAHHLGGGFLAGRGINSDVGKASIIGMYGIQMYEKQKELAELIKNNPTMEVEIIDCFDEVCSSCFKGPTKTPYNLPEEDLYDFDDQRSHRLWADYFSGWRKIKCNNNGQKKADYKYSKLFRAQIGSIITAKQVSEISHIHYKYFSNPFNIISYGEKHLEKLFKEELKRYHQLKIS